MLSSTFGTKWVLLLLVVVSVIVNVKGGSEAGDCQDKKTNCHDYSNDDCIDFPSWAKINCAKTCGKCNRKPTACPEEWTYYKGDQSCIKGFGIPTGRGSKTWFMARSHCVGFEGDLITIKDQAKHDFLMSQYGMYWFEVWIGTISISTERDRFDFRFVDGSKLGSFHPWHTGNPDNQDGKEKCVVFNKELNWMDKDCGAYKMYICSKPAWK